MVDQDRAASQSKQVEGGAEADLDRLLSTSGMERDVLGLLAAAGGGLSSRDLTELIGAGPADIEKTLDTAACPRPPGRDVDF